MDPIALAGEVESWYRRYLQTTFHFKDPILRASFADALGRERLSKGPFLEATPVFKRSDPPARLFPALLGSAAEPAFTEALWGERPLYGHQEAAIRISDGGGNVVVATGTGSGKTESFLYPILLHLYREHERGRLGSGVRAMILYPMNALANDQRERLGEIASRLKHFGSRFAFTFGQYIGETPEDASDTRRRAHDHLRARMPGELVLRSEMREAPPQILLTNYSMLEYLLLRPDDSPLFDDGQAHAWTYIVLDEAHQYRGSRGIEMAMLLRRLKQRLRKGGRHEPFKCIATSATLVRGEDDKSLVARFASDLFGEPFEHSGVILGTTEPIREAATASLEVDDYAVIEQAFSDSSAEPVALASIARRVGASLETPADAATIAGSILARDVRAERLRRLTLLETRDVAEIASEVFSDQPPSDQVVWLSRLVNILMRTKDKRGAPLLTARYHVFLRSLEGAFVCHLPSPHVVLERGHTDTNAGDTPDLAQFEVALCRECGQHYFVGKVQDKLLREAVRDPSELEFGTEYYRPAGDAEMDEEDEARPSHVLCVRCGAIGQRATGCSHPEQIAVIREKKPADEDRADQVSRCGACGYTSSGRGPVRGVVYGSDGPNAVIATTLFCESPPDRRKVLAFADGRQDAAYFAWYLEDSYAHIVERNSLLQTTLALARQFDGEVTLRELAAGLADHQRHHQLVSPTTGELDLRRASNITVFREFLTDEPRISLEGVGLLRWTLKRPPSVPVSRTLQEPPWSLSAEEAWHVIQELLLSMRAERAVTVRAAEPVPRWEELELQPPLRFRLGAPGGNNQIRSWDGARGRRAKYLGKLARLVGMTESEAGEASLTALRAIWDEFAVADESATAPDEQLLLAVEDGRRLNPDWWRVRAVQPNEELYRCDTCGRLQSTSVRGICPRARCTGTLSSILAGSLRDNHYRRLYERPLPGLMRVEEHTGQLSHERARAFQRDFKQGKVHVLSCSTTFELGVDLGDLDVIFLRNVPPEAFNYAQRVGRAGRRASHPGLAITYCKRSPHDLYHFGDPSRMLSGKVRPPTLCIRNEKIVLRHVMATALSAYLRAHPSHFKNISAFFKDLEKPTGTSDIRAFLQQHIETLQDALRAIVPDEIAKDCGVFDGSWIQKIVGQRASGDVGEEQGDSRMALAELEVSSDFRTALGVERAASDARNYGRAAWAHRRAETIARENLLSFLSRKAIIPKYGFPVDVVELDTMEGYGDAGGVDISLQRDLIIGISEFAPTSQVIANKRLWTSYGLKKVAEREWPRRRYKKCPEHQAFYQWNEGQDEPPTTCGHQLPVASYIAPIFGFVTSREQQSKEPTSRPSRVFSTRPYFSRTIAREGIAVQLPEANPVVLITPTSPGVMVVICEGRRGDGFWICPTCGAGFRKRITEHRTPFGTPCAKQLESVSLGHEFVTDVLRLNFVLKPVDPATNTWFAYSLGCALVEGAAEALEVPPNDLNITVASGSSAVNLPSIVLYDAVPGGAGIVARLEDPEIFRDAVRAACAKLGKCDCGDLTSCYGCLRSYRNQFAHPHLQRGPTLRYLQMLYNRLM